jgi:MtN3 and saliva related transmembrane protein
MINNENISILGIIAGTLTTISFLPQVIKIYKDKDTKSLSLSMFILFFIGMTFWLLYSIFLNKIEMIIPNGITLFLSSYILYMKITENKRTK